MKNGPEEILGVVFCVVYSVRNESSISPGPMPNPAVKRSTADGTAEGIRGMAREPNQCFSDLCESASLSTMAREPKGRFCLLCEVG